MNPLLQGPSSIRLDGSFLRLCRRARRTPARQISAHSASRAPALAQAVQVSQPGPSTPQTDEALSENIRSFFRRSHPYVVIPTPVPYGEETSSSHDYYFPDSPTQDMLAILDTCLHEAYDVPRAKYVFEMLRQKRKGDSVINTPLLNSMLEAYLLMASERDVAQRSMWVKNIWELYESMELGKERQAPNAVTYAIVFLTWLRFNIDSENAVLDATERDPNTLLRSILSRQVPVEAVVSSYPMTSSEEAAQIIQHLSRAAANTNNPGVIVTLARLEQMGADPMENIPEARPVVREIIVPEPGKESAEEGAVKTISEVPFNLDNLRKHLGDIAFARKVLPDDVSSRQKLLESSVYDVAQERLRHESEKLEQLGLGDKGLKDRGLQAWMYDWHQKLEPRLRAEIRDVVEQERKLEKKISARRLATSHTKVEQLGSFLTLLSPTKLSLITILELMQLQGTGGVSEGMKTARALLTVGRAVELEYKAEVLKKHNIQVPAVLTRAGDSSYFTKKAYDMLQQRRLAAQSHFESATEWSADWTANLRVRVGSFLVNCLMEVATVVRLGIHPRTRESVEEEQPAFYHTYEYVFGHKLGVIRLNPIVAARLVKDEVSETVHPRHLPMLVPPKPWISYNDGGYIYNKNVVMRFKDVQEQLAYVREASDKGSLELVYAALDILGSTAWKINRPVFDVVIKVWNTGERFLKIPPVVFDIPEPVKPANYDSDPQAKAKYLPNFKRWAREKADAHSDRCSVNYKVEIARAFVADTIYFPHNVDFRGRAYPIPPHLNHVGDDLSRGLLTFAEAKPLGESGFRWLKIHMANLYGYDKANLDERVAFTEEHIDDIMDSAKDPLGGRGWWKKADDPWQCLATCIDLTNAIESGNPHEYLSSQPVHQDGTCNGLQHYAALGGDTRGAQQVNLDVADRPSDVYTFVANMVEEKIAKDYDKGHEHALLLKGRITRKVVKQTVMTTVYGVTFVGARAQIEKQLLHQGDIPAERCYSASSYLAKEVLSAIGDLFAGAKDIQLWFTACARLIAKSIPPERIEELLTAIPKAGDPGHSSKLAKALVKEQMTSVVWTTPLGLPIVQPYRKAERKQVMTALQTVYISDPNAPAQVNVLKQASAFPPNYIHSLDATHMMLTAIACRNSDLTYASVHDSYWSHASTIDKMSEIIRDTFIILHQANAMEKLEKEFRERYAEYKIPTSILGKSKSLFSTIVGKKNPTIKMKRTRTTKKVTTEEDEEPEDEEHSEEVNSTSYDLDLYELEARCMPGFVYLVDLLPPVPKKGDFDVTKIKESKYFFS